MVSHVLPLRPLFLVLLLSVALLPGSVEAGHGPIQPGGQVSTSIGSCTLNFVFDGAGSLAGRSFIGTAAHCVREPGERVSIDGHRNIAPVFYVGDVPNAVNGDGRGDNGYPGRQLDFALIEVTDASIAVSAEVRGHPGMPNAYTLPGHTSTGNRVLLSGHGLGFGVTEPTREMRQGVLSGDDARTYNAYAPAISGDSGGPVLHFSGKALGIASTIGLNGLAGPTVQGAIEELDALGIPITLRTA